MKNKKILIVGAGITGVALAALLEKSNYRVDIIEKSTSWKHCGYGITVMPTGLEVLRELGVLTEVRAEGTSALGFNLMKPDGTLIRHIALKAGGVDSITLDRSDLHTTLRHHLHNSKITMNEEVIAISQDGNGVAVRFKDGRQQKYDLVIGADGVRSSIRKLIFPQFKPTYAGAAIWTFFLPPDVDLPPGHNVMQVWNDNEFMGVFPFKKTAAVTFSMPVDQNTDINDIDLKDHFKDIDFLAKEITAKIGKHPLYAGYLNEVKLHDWYVGNIILAGDAAHSMMPATGMGASMGLADAKVLANLITTLNEADWEIMPQLYQHKRKTIVDRTQRQAYLIGRSMFLSSPFKNLRDETIKALPQFVISHSLQRS